MRKQWKIATGLLLSAVVIASAVGLQKGSFFKFKTSDIAQKEADAGTYHLPDDYNANKDLVIVEVVPDYTYAQLSYGVEGNEPINLMEACQEGYAEEIKKLFSDNLYKEYTPGYYLNQDEYEEVLGMYFKNDPLKAAEYVTGPSIVDGSNAYQFINKSGEVSDQSFLVTRDSVLKNKLTELMKATENKVKVYTITTEELNNSDLSELSTFLNDVDLMVFSQSYIKGKEDLQKSLVESYGANGHNKERVTFDAKFTDSGKDLDWDVVEKIFNSIGAKKNPLSVVMDSSVYTDALVESLDSTKKVTTHQYLLNRNVKYENNQLKTLDSNITGGYDGLFTEKKDFVAKADGVASNNNTYKLFLMSMFRDPTEFCNLFVESGLITDGKYQLQKESNADEYWNTYTFLPCKGDLPGEDPENPEAADDAYWKNKMNICVELSSKDYVNGNVLSLDFSNQPFYDQLDQTKTFTSNVDQTQQKTLMEVLYHKESGKDAEGVMAYEPLACVDGKTYQVLDIEPACSINKYSLNLVDIERIIPYTSYSKSSSFSLNITRMSTAEFIGRTENLISTYDMIYIGRDVTGLNTLNDAGKVPTYGETATTGSTYNKDMEGVIYAHVGGAVQFMYDNGAGFSLESESGIGKANGVALYAKSGDENKRSSSGKLMYSGNDITNKKKEEIEEFCKAGLPVLVAEGLIDDATSSDPKLFNDKNCNNMLKLLSNSNNDFMDLGYNYRTARKNGTASGASKLSANKPVLTLKSISYNDRLESNKTITDKATLNSNIVYDFLSTSADRRITFKYTIEDADNPGAEYECQLYIDKNADGVFKEDEAIGNKKTVNAGNTEQSVSCDINTIYRGALTWKIELTNKSNRSVQVMRTGYGTVRLGNLGDKKPVKVLQVVASGAHATSWGTEKAQNVNLWESDSGFPALFNQLEDYSITMSHTTLASFNGYSLSAMSQYDMIIFGFADSFRDLDMHGPCCENVQKYIKQGNSVLFTHDLTSQINDQGVFTAQGSHGNAGGTGRFLETTNGYAFNRYLRDAMGLNRFGLPLSEATADAYDNTEVGDKMGFTYSCLMQYSNFKKAWNGGSKTNYLGPYRKLYVSFDSANPPWPDIHANTNDDMYQTHYVNNVNDGQITKYPFDLSKETGDQKTAKLADGTSETRYKIAPTHGQYYQLNMEDEDIICWYTLSDGVVENEKWFNKGWYTRSLKDVSNNYYIYSNGNVTYSGVGHSKSSAMTTFEKKLFVNTMVAALRAGIEGPLAHIQDAYNMPTEDGEERYVVYADVDADSSDDDFNTNQNVDFYLTDDSVKDGNTDSLYLTVEIETDQKDENGNMIWKDVTKDSDYKVYKVDGSTETSIQTDTLCKAHEFDLPGAGKKSVMCYRVDRSSVTAGTIQKYRIKYPKIVLKDQNEQNFRLTVYNKNNAYSHQLGAVMRMTLFKLD